MRKERFFLTVKSLQTSIELPQCFLKVCETTLAARSLFSKKVLQHKKL